MPARNLTSRQKDLLLDALMYRATPGQREAVWHEVPDAYNAYVGEELVRVVRVGDLPTGDFVPPWCQPGARVTLVKPYDSAWPRDGRGQTGVVKHVSDHQVIVGLDNGALENLHPEDDGPFVTIDRAQHGEDAVSKFLEPIS